MLLVTLSGGYLVNGKVKLGGTFMAMAKNRWLFFLRQIVKQNSSGKYLGGKR